LDRDTDLLTRFAARPDVDPINLLPDAWAQRHLAA
jgi:hypothetical protein